MFIIGAALFALGSLIASLSTGVPSLVIGEAIIEGAGASLMLPATMSIMSSTFVGRERATAFAAWGAVLGAAVAFGPLLGGFLTTNYSWRWAFRVNVIVAPLAIVGALLFVRRTPRSTQRERIDVPGALLIASGMFMLVFGISEGATYGWWRPRRRSRRSARALAVVRPISIVPVAFLLAGVLLFAFYRVQLRQGARRRRPAVRVQQPAPPRRSATAHHAVAHGDGPGRVPAGHVGPAARRPSPLGGRHRPLARAVRRRHRRRLAGSAAG